MDESEFCGVKMIVFPGRQLVIVTPPKCGSTALHEHLSKAGGIHAFGPSPIIDDNGEPAFHLDQHSAEFPYAWKSFCRVLVVRSPFDRLRSLFHWDLNHRTERKIPFRSDVEFAEHVVSGVDPFQHPIAERYAGIEFQQIWKLERIEFHLSDNNLKHGVKKRNQSKFRSVPFSLEAYEIASDWLKIDAMKYDY